METIEQKIEKIQVMLENLELKIHRKILEKEDEEKLTLTYINRN